MSPICGFDDLWTDAVQQIDAVFGEDFSLEFYTQPLKASGRLDVNAEAVRDTGREPVPFRATFREVGAKVHAKGRTMAQDITRPIAGDGPHLRVTIPGEGFERPRIGDRILRIATGERFRVTGALARGRNSLQVALAPVTA